MLHARNLKYFFIVLFLFSCLKSYADNQITIIKVDPNNPVFTKKSMVEMLFDYNPQLIHFKRASNEMIEAAIQDRVISYFYDEKGKEYKIPIDLSTLPFWVYATYTETTEGKNCTYALVDGFTPKIYDGYVNMPRINEPIVYDQTDLNAAVIKNCGDGYDLVSHEVYGSPFDIGNSEKDIPGYITPTASKKLAQNFVQNVIKAFGGKEKLQVIIDEQYQMSKNSKFPFDFRNYFPMIKNELLLAGIIDPTKK